jgi:hypothetical protein
MEWFIIAAGPLARPKNNLKHSKSACCRIFDPTLRRRQWLKTAENGAIL